MEDRINSQKIIFIFFVLIFVTVFADAEMVQYGVFTTAITHYQPIETGPDEIKNYLSANIQLTQNLDIYVEDFIGRIKLKLMLDSVTKDVNMNLDYGYVSFQKSLFAVSLGKERISYGYGFTWNPVDIMNPLKSPLYQDAELRAVDEGVILMSISHFYTINNLTYDLKAIALPEEDLNEVKGVFSGNFQIYSLELLLVAGLEENEKNIFTGGVRFPLPFLDMVTVYHEFQSKNFDEDWKILIGLQLNPVLPFSDLFVQIQVEYFHNFSGYESMDDFFTENSDQIPVLLETHINYLYNGITIASLQGSLSAGYVFNFEDYCGLFTFQGSYFLFDECKIKAGGYFPVYKENEDELAFLLNRKYEVYMQVSLYY